MSKAIDKIKSFFQNSGKAVKNFFNKLGVAHASCIAMIAVSAILGI